MGALYLVGYLALAPGSNHDTHPMERNANYLAGLPLDWDGRRVPDWSYPRDPRFPKAMLHRHEESARPATGACQGEEAAPPLADGSLDRFVRRLPVRR